MWMWYQCPPQPLFSVRARLGPDSGLGVGFVCFALGFCLFLLKTQMTKQTNRTEVITHFSSSEVSLPPRDCLSASDVPLQKEKRITLCSRILTYKHLLMFSLFTLLID